MVGILVEQSAPCTSGELKWDEGIPFPLYAKGVRQPETPP